ncbi:hypothetical protein ACWCO9_18430 [Streptomyces sp. NPDC001937]
MQHRLVSDQFSGACGASNTSPVRDKRWAARSSAAAQVDDGRLGGPCPGTPSAKYFESSPADECAFEGEEGFVDVVAKLSADL